MRWAIEALRRWLFRGWTAVALCSCSGTTDNPACSPVSLTVVEAAHTEATQAVIAGGKCDAYEIVDDCPEMQKVNLQFEGAYQGWRLCR